MNIKRDHTYDLFFVFYGAMLLKKTSTLPCAAGSPGGLAPARQYRKAW